MVVHQLFFPVFIFLAYATITSSLENTTELMTPKNIACLLSVPPIGILAQMTLIYTVYINKPKKYASSFFTLLFFLIIPPLYWCPLLMYQGICLTLNYCPGSDTFNMYFMSTGLYFYGTCMFATLFVAFNRFTAIFFWHRYEQICGKKMTRLYIFVIILGPAIVNSPNWYYLLRYSPAIGTWTYVNIPSDDMKRILKTIDLSFAYTMHVLVFLLYFCSFIKYRSQLVKSEGQRKEYKLMVLGTLGSVACFLFLTFHHIIPVPTLEFMSLFLCAFSDPLVYLGFNAEIRKDLKEIVTGALRKQRVHPSESGVETTQGMKTETPAHGYVDSNAGTRSGNYSVVTGVHQGQPMATD